MLPTFRLSNARFPAFLGALLLVQLGLTPPVSAKPVSFGKNYTLDLPEGWKVQQASPELKATGPAGINLRAAVYPLESSLDALADQYVTTLDAQPGYKLAERGMVAHAGGRKATLLRYNIANPKAAITSVTYLLPLAADQVAMVTFAFPSANVQKARADVERIYNSVSGGEAVPAADSSWLTPAKPDAGIVGAQVGGPAAEPKGARAGGAETNFGSASLILPAGWSGKSSDDMFEGKGPNDATIIASSFASDKTPDQILETRLGTFRGVPGFELLDKDPVTTKAGAKGQLAFYKQKTRGVLKAEVAVAIATAPNQIALILVSTPLQGDKPDHAFESAVEEIFGSVKAQP